MRFTVESRRRRETGREASSDAAVVFSASEGAGAAETRAEVWGEKAPLANAKMPKRVYEGESFMMAIESLSKIEKKAFSKSD
jgi:hypothetical protein